MRRMSWWDCAGGISNSYGGQRFSYGAELLAAAMSNLQSNVLKEAISQIVVDAKEKNRKFTETVELQIGLKNYDPQKDKCFNGYVKLPHILLPKDEGLHAW